MALATVIEHPDPARLGRRLVVRPDGRRGVGPAPAGRLGSPRADDAVADDALGLLAPATTRR